MSRDEAIRRIKAREAEIRALGVRAVYLFGSTARDEARPDSDVDVFVDFDEGKLGFQSYFDAEETIQSALGSEVDFTTRGGLHPFLKDEIERGSTRVF